MNCKNNIQFFAFTKSILFFFCDCISVHCYIIYKEYFLFINELYSFIAIYIYLLLIYADKYIYIHNIFINISIYNIFINISIYITFYTYLSII